MELAARLKSASGLEERYFLRLTTIDHFNIRMRIRLWTWLMYGVAVEGVKNILVGLDIGIWERRFWSTPTTGEGPEFTRAVRPPPQKRLQPPRATAGSDEAA